ncbi:hypothetical protein [Pedobacter steynii]
MVDNEVEILQSKTLMARVVKKLNLNVNFKTEGRVVSRDLYEKRPVDFQTFEMRSDYFGKEFKLSFTSADQYTLENTETGKKLAVRLISCKTII